MTRYIIEAGKEIAYNNHVDFCIGTGRMGLALQKEYMEQLKLVQEEIGFSHIRGHGLFSDDMAIYHEFQDESGEVHAEYNFTYLDMVMDSYRAVGLKPFLELGFMPEQLASGTQTVFYWKGNTTPPKEYARWNTLVTATLSHLMARYGADEVVTWPIEVWNEPNLPGFWLGADMQEYFKLFQETFLAIKQLDERFLVGGPAICGVDDKRWMDCFMKFCREEKLAIDFVTRHHYTTEVPEKVGHYDYAKLSDAEFGFENLKSTREIIDSYEEYRGLPIHITEFNTSYVPDCPLHDTNRNAAYMAEQLSRLGDVNESYSYWTFGDLFEEAGVPYTPFHGGFGLVTDGCIRKPTFWTFRFYKLLQEGVCVGRYEDAYIIRMADGSYRGILWYKTMSGENGGTRKELELDFPAEKPLYSLITKTVDEDTCNPLKLWHVMGEPANLTMEQKALLKEADKPLVEGNILKSREGRVSAEFFIKENGVVYFELMACEIKSDRGYSYERAIQTV
ncbi:MAG: glycosyl hydrolase [Lachnospiraceae bacterium]